MVEHDDRTGRTSGMTTWRAGCGESRTSGSEGGPEKPTRREPVRALRSDPYERHEALVDRAVMRGHRLRLVAAGRVKLRAA
jgi:hypothetical protein